MNPVTAAYGSLGEYWRRGVRCAYEHARLQYHPALYVLLYAVTLTVVLTPLLWALNFLFEPRYTIDYLLLGAFTACAAVAELVRGHVKYWLNASPYAWSFWAMAAGGGSFGLTLWAISYLLHGKWTQPWLFAAGGAAFYLALGLTFWLAERAARKKSS